MWNRNNLKTQTMMLVAWTQHCASRSATKDCKRLAKNEIPLFPHPAYLPDLLPSDFFLLLRLTIGIKEGNMMRSPWVTISLEAPMKCQTTHFTKCFCLWSNYWARSVPSPGDYTDRDSKCCCYGEIYTVHKDMTVLHMPTSVQCTNPAQCLYLCNTQAL